MKVVGIRQKLEQLDISIEDLVLGDFDYIGQFTAMRSRDRNDPLYKSVGAFYRAQYERGILVYSLIRRFNMTSMLEIGTGRGYTTLCAAKAFNDAGINGRIVTIDPNLNEEFFRNVSKIFPPDWFRSIEFLKGTSREVVPTLKGRFDLIYVDGAHDHDNVKFDIETTVPLCEKAMLLDDYHLPSKNDPGIQCATAIDEFDWSALFDEPECVRLDRRIFVDDRRLSDEQVDYGQVLALRRGLLDGHDW